MFAAIRRRATFANICSFLALTLVLGMGSAYAAGTIRSKDIVNGQVKTVDLGNNSVTTGKIKDGEVQVGDLDADSVGSDEIATDAVAATEIADDSIDGGEIIDDSLTASDLRPGSVGSSELADGGVAGADIAGNTITGSNVASDSISTADLVGTDIIGAINIPSGYVPIGQCKSLDITVSGAVADQTVVISARAALPVGQLLYGAEVPVGGHVTMFACNLSGSTWDALSSFPIRIVTFG